MSLPKLFKRLIADVIGGAAIEYGLIAALIALASIGALGSVANENSGFWALLSDKVEENMGS